MKITPKFDYVWKNKIICIAGKNKCSIDFLKFTAKKLKKNILVLPNKSDKVN